MFNNIKFEKKGYNNVQPIEISLIFARDFVEFIPKKTKSSSKQAKNKSLNIYLNIFRVYESLLFKRD